MDHQEVLVEEEDSVGGSISQALLKASTTILKMVKSYKTTPSNPLSLLLAPKLQDPLS
ncbi:hypothetical protein AXF42_Ash001561 [Apostasia shenzhenica]|uniref:Uncharacterized protein n=1 Tax=Apostasia shenzhenica TaxID=1088818 RepID=A0A2I0AAK2_9ASPA|nr:hypothetical protein AXF42_Ash001561 [Apostasia shenzhenica]